MFPLLFMICMHEFLHGFAGEQWCPADNPPHRGLSAGCLLPPQLRTDRLFFQGCKALMLINFQHVWSNSDVNQAGET